MKDAIVPARLGRLFTAVEAAQYLGIGIEKARRAIARGELVAMRTASGRIEGVYQADCDAWIDARRQLPQREEVRTHVDVLVSLLPGADHFA